MHILQVIYLIKNAKNIYNYVIMNYVANMSYSLLKFL